MPDEEGGACVQTAEAAERGGVGCGGWVEVGQAGLPAAAVPDLEVDQTSAAGNGTACASVRPLPNTHPCMPLPLPPPTRPNPNAPWK